METDATLRPRPGLLQPPGGFFIWMLVVLELATFGVALVALVVSARNDPETYHQSRLLLDPRYGIANTVFLLTSGYFMAESVRHFHQADRPRARRGLWLAIAGGLAFLCLKGVEYADKISHGRTLGSDPFFTWYWLLTVFHLMHVLVGLVILAVLLRRLSTIKSEDFEAGGIFWHMCDLIWLLLFPILYLIF